MSEPLTRYVVPPQTYPAVPATSATTTTTTTTSSSGHSSSSGNTSGGGGGGGSAFDANKKTIIIDLDSTLVYTFIDKPEGYNGGDCWFLDDVVEDSGSVTTYYVLIRPYARRFLERCMGYYNVVFFTAAEREYAEPIFERLCPEVTSERRYYRDSCTVNASVYTKNLGTLAGLHFDERRVFLFDDNAPDNTIPRSNGMFCSQFAPDDDDDGSVAAIDSLLRDNALEAFADLFCSDRFLHADDVRVPLAEYDKLFNKRLAEPTDG